MERGFSWEGNSGLVGQESLTAPWSPSVHFRASRNKPIVQFYLLIFFFTADKMCSGYESFASCLKITAHKSL
jgi:hypothetical protein